MVGGIVLVRNRLISLGINIADESMSTGFANFRCCHRDFARRGHEDPHAAIKKVFGRFPRVFVDLARAPQRRKLALELEGEENRIVDKTWLKH